MMMFIQRELLLGQPAPISMFIIWNIHSTGMHFFFVYDDNEVGICV